MNDFNEKSAMNECMYDKNPKNTKKVGKWARRGIAGLRYQASHPIGCINLAIVHPCARLRLHTSWRIPSLIAMATVTLLLIALPAL